MTDPVRKTRCAVYTRKSSDEGLEQEFNSLDAQREACEAYVTSQKHEGWLLVPDRYDDGGISGGTLDRPALKRLMVDTENGLIDVIVVYKVDRLTRSLTDFSKLVEVFDRTGVSFVSITQQFNTTNSMGRLTLNMLLSFAQYEREVIGERIRDKFAASRRRGMWMGGHPPLGYEVKNRKLVVVEDEAQLVRHIFQRFVTLTSVTRLIKELTNDGYRTKSRTAATGRHYPGRSFNKTDIYKLLRNRIYLGETVHKGEAFPGEHDAIIEKHLWNQVHATLKISPRARANASRSQTPSLLKGLLYSPDGHAMTPSHTRKNGKLYRYYVTTTVLKESPERCPVGRVAAAEIEQAVIAQLRALLTAPELVSRTANAVRESGDLVSEREVMETLQQFEALWDELFPAEQARIVHLLVDRIDMQSDNLDVRLQLDGLHSLIAALQNPETLSEVHEAA